MTIIVRDDIFTDAEKNDIEKYLTGDFPWHLGEGHENTAGQELLNHFKENNPIFEHFQLCHGAILNGKINSPFSELFLEMNKRFEKAFEITGTLQRVKANLQPKVYTDLENCFNTPHIDNLLPHWVLLYYVNDADGDTFIFDNEISKDGFDWNNKVYYDPSQYPKHLSIRKRIEPRKGRTVMFDGKFLHAGMHPRNADYRIVINFNIEKA